VTIGEAIELLTKLKGRHGDIEVFFDCPQCGKSFSPSTVTAMAVHFSDEESVNSGKGRKNADR